MKPPRIHPMLSTIVKVALTTVDGTIFSVRDKCPVCGGPLSGYDKKKKQYALMREDEQERKLYVFVKRFYCHTCHHVCYADEPFYPGTRVGSAVIDLVVLLSRTMPPNRVAAYLAALGVCVDRTTCRLYARKNLPEIQMMDLFGIRIPVSIFSLSTLAAQTGEGGTVPGAEILRACGFPSAYRAAPDSAAGAKERDQGYKQEDKEERELQKPEDEG